MAIQSTTRSDHLIRSLIGKNNMVRYFRKDAEFEAANAKVSWLGEQIPKLVNNMFFCVGDILLSWGGEIGENM